jgi:hypothetical protein
MPLIPLRARVALLHDGVSVNPGDTFEAVPPVAAALHYQGKVDFATTTAPPEPIRKRRTYKRRDLQAEL